MKSMLHFQFEAGNTERTHQGKMCCGRTPLETLQDGKNGFGKRSY